MDSQFFEKLERLDLIRGGNACQGAIARAPARLLLDLAQETADLTSGAHFIRERSIFAQAASLSLSGGPSGCGALECRIRRAEHLGQYAAMYADKVYIHNFLAARIAHADSRGSAELAEGFFDDLSVFVKLRPLIEAGLVVVFTPDVYCSHCLVKRSFGADADKRFDSEIRQLRNRFLQEIEARFEWDSECIDLDVSGPETLIEHGGMAITYRREPVVLRRQPKLRQQLYASGSAPLTRDLIRRTGLHRRLANDIIADVRFELAAAQALGTSFLTNQQLHIDILQSLTGNAEIERRNRLAQRHLTSLVPFLHGVDLNLVLRVREQEGDAFTLYRQSLNKAINEYRKQRDELSERDAQAIYSDIIEPELARLNVKVNSARRALTKSVRRRVTAWVGAVSFGTYSGFVPDGVVTAAKALGLAQVLANLLERLMQGSDVEEAIRTEDLFFLWKVRQAAPD